MSSSIFRKQIVVWAHSSLVFLFGQVQKFKATFECLEVRNRQRGFSSIRFLYLFVVKSIPLWSILFTISFVGQQVECFPADFDISQIFTRSEEKITLLRRGHLIEQIVIRADLAQPRDVCFGQDRGIVG